MESKSASIIILSGGTSVRFGSDKSLALIEGKSLISRILSAIPLDFEIIIVGPDPQMENVSYCCVQETPLHGGPVAGIKAGLTMCTNEIVALIATDMPFATARIVNLFNSMTSSDECVMYVDDAGIKQPLAAVYRVDALEKALLDMGAVTGKSMRELISYLEVQVVSMTHEVAQALMDIDTPADLARAIAYSSALSDNLRL